MCVYERGRIRERERTRESEREITRKRETVKEFLCVRDKKRKRDI